MSLLLRVTVSKVHVFHSDEIAGKVLSLFIVTMAQFILMSLHLLPYSRTCCGYDSGDGEQEFKQLFTEQGE